MKSLPLPILQPKQIVQVDARWESTLLCMLQSETLEVIIVHTFQILEIRPCRQYSSPCLSFQCVSHNPIQGNFGQGFNLLKITLLAEINIADAGAHEQVQCLSDGAPRSVLNFQRIENHRCFFIKPRFVFSDGSARNVSDVDFGKFFLDRTYNATFLVSKHGAIYYINREEPSQQIVEIDRLILHDKTSNCFHEISLGATPPLACALAGMEAKP